MKRLIKKVAHAMGYEVRKRVPIPRGPSEVWIDVGAHFGEITFPAAYDNPNLIVFAFEPNLILARKLMGRLKNFVALPLAVSEKNGSAEFFMNVEDATSSLLPFDPDGLAPWGDIAKLETESKITVPTIRLDTFLLGAGIMEVDFLKIDTQGADLDVVRSAGGMLRKIKRITLEADVSPIRLYRGSASKDEIVQYLLGRGFELTLVEEQHPGLDENLTFVRRS